MEQHGKYWNKSLTMSELYFNAFTVQRPSAVHCSGLIIVSPHADSFAIPLWGGKTFDEEMPQIMFRDGSSFQHVLCCHITLCQRKVTWMEQERYKRYIWIHSLCLQLINCYSNMGLRNIEISKQWKELAQNSVHKWPNLNFGTQGKSICRIFSEIFFGT